MKYLPFLLESFEKTWIVPRLSRRAPVAQLDRAPDYGSGGWGFDSLRVCQAFGCL